MSDWFDVLIWRVTIPFTLAMLLVMLIETLPLRLAAVHRSWLWRGVYLKTILIALLPSATVISVGVPEFLQTNSDAEVGVSSTADVWRVVVGFDVCLPLCPDLGNDLFR